MAGVCARVRASLGVRNCERAEHCETLLAGRLRYVQLIRCLHNKLLPRGRAQAIAGCVVDAHAVLEPMELHERVLVEWVGGERAPESRACARVQRQRGRCARPTRRVYIDPGERRVCSCDR